MMTYLAKKVQTKYGLMPEWVQIMLLDLENPETPPERLSRWKEGLLNEDSYEDDSFIVLESDTMFSRPLSPFPPFGINKLFLDFGDREDIREDAIAALAANPNLPTNEIIDFIDLALRGRLKGEVLKAALSNPVLPLLILENPNLSLNFVETGLIEDCLNLKNDDCLSFHPPCQVVLELPILLSQAETTMLKTLILNSPSLTENKNSKLKYGTIKYDENNV